MNTLEEAQQLNLLEVLVRCDMSVSPPPRSLSLSPLSFSLFRSHDSASLMLRRRAMQSV